MTSQFQYLFSPLRVGAVTLPNRIMSTGHMTEMARDFLPTDQLIAYQYERARGGTGLIVTEANAVHPSGRTAAEMLCIHEDRSIPAYRRLTDRVHEYPTRIFCQLFHGGSEIYDLPLGMVAVSASTVPSERYHLIPRALEIEEVEEMIECYGQAARRAREAGYDGVEVVASHGYLPAQFWSPRFNLRTDAYGGNFENRMRFVDNVVRAIRREAGDDFTVGIRVSGDEMLEGSLDVAAMVEICQYLDRARGLDYINVIGGHTGSFPAAAMIVPPAPTPLGNFTYASSAIKQAVSMPVFVGSRINEVTFAEQVLASGHADVVGMTRALICDPHMPYKARAGDLEDIRLCIGCNQACIGHMHKLIPISCIQNPVTGREDELLPLVPARQQKRVMVVGGGPGGMQAAVVLAQRGHAVTLYEASGELGGQVNLARRAPHRVEMGDLVQNFSRELQREGVEVRCGARVNRALVEETQPDCVILATGSRPYVPPVPGADGDRVCTAWDILEGKADHQRRVVVVDYDGNVQGVSAAEYLADGGAEVIYVSGTLTFGESLQAYIRTHYLGRFYEKGIEIIQHHRLKAVGDGAVTIENVFTPLRRTLDGIQAVALALGQVPDDSLWRALKGSGLDVRRIGDCVQARTIEEAVYEGALVGREI